MEATLTFETREVRSVKYYDEAVPNLLTRRLMGTTFQNAVSVTLETQKQGVSRGAVIDTTPALSYLLYAGDLIVWNSTSNTAHVQEAATRVSENMGLRADRNKMTVSPEKTIFQPFTLSTEPASITLKYKRNGLSEPRISKYLSVDLDSELS